MPDKPGPGAPPGQLPDRPQAGDARSLPYPAHRLAPPMELVDLAREIAQADAMLTGRLSAKLQVIAEQVRSLQDQARRILDEARRDRELNHARCQFQKIPGRLYHLYRRPDGELEFSMLAPADWGGRPPRPYVGSYRLEPDLSWTPLEALESGNEAADDGREVVVRLLGQAPEL